MQTETKTRRMFETASRLLSTGKTEDALTVIDYLTMLEPACSEYWVAGGMARMRLGSYEEASISFQVAEASSDLDPVPVLLRGLCRLRQGRLSEGTTAIRRAHSLALATGDRSWVIQTIEQQLENLGDRPAA